jgi:cell division initiation protein
MQLTPMDVQHKRFRKQMRGYAPEEVDAFLREVARVLDDLNQRVREVESRTKNQEREINEMAEREKILKETLVTAQRLSENLKKDAVKDAERIIQDAHTRGERLIEQAHHKAQEVYGEIRELQRQRIQLDSQIRAVLRAHSELLTSMNQRPAVAAPASAPQTTRPVGNA